MTDNPPSLKRKLVRVNPIPAYPLPIISHHCLPSTDSILHFFCVSLCVSGIFLTFAPFLSLNGRFRKLQMGGATSPRVREVQAQDVERETGQLLVFLSHARLKDRGASEESAMPGLEWKLSVLCKISGYEEENNCKKAIPCPMCRGMHFEDRKSDAGAVAPWRRTQ